MFRIDFSISMIELKYLLWKYQTIMILLVLQRNPDIIRVHFVGLESTDTNQKSAFIVATLK